MSADITECCTFKPPLTLTIYKNTQPNWGHMSHAIVVESNHIQFGWTLSYKAEPSNFLAFSCITVQCNGLEPYREAERWQSEEMTLNVKKRPAGIKATINLSVYIEGETAVRCDTITSNHISEKKRYLT